MIQAFVHNLNQWDTIVCLHIFGWNGKKAVDRVMKSASKAGDGYFYPVIGLLVFLLDRTVAMQLLPAAVMAFALELVLQKILKHSIRRMRPCNLLPEINNLISLPDEFSFPSGHTAASFLMATILSAFYPLVAIPAFLVALLIGISRVYNGVHYPGDVIVGSVLGLMTAKIGLAIF